MPTTKRKPTLKQKRFVTEYLKTGNATEAAIRVYKTKDRGVAQSIGSENLSKLVIQEEIKPTFDEANITRTYVLKGTCELAEQRKELNVALGAYKFIAELLKLINANTDSDRTALPSDSEARAETARKSIEALAQLASLPGGRFALFVESGNTGIQSHNGDAPQGSNGVHPDMG